MDLRIRCGFIIPRKRVNQINELYHYGIKGMHWGVRRFQNADGSYTAAGRARYNVGGYRGTKKSKQVSPNGVKSTGTKLKAAKSISDDSANMSRQTANLLRRSASKARSRKQKPMDLSHMSDQELRDRVNRGNLERQYAQLYGSSQVASGRDHVADTLDVLGTGIAVAGSAASLGLTIWSIKNGKGV